MLKFHNIYPQSKAFTLIELLIVVAIIAILAAIAVPNFLEAQTRSKVARAKADLRTFAIGMESYRVDQNDYISGQAYTDLDPSGGAAPLWLLSTPVAYLTEVPHDPPFGAGKTNFTANGYIYMGGDSFFAPDPTYGGRSLIQLYVEDHGFYHESWINLNWLAYGIGPIKVHSLTEVGFQTPYDPTNGTVSTGDIIYISGAGAGEGWHSFH